MNTMRYAGLKLSPTLTKQSKNISLFEYENDIYEFVFHRGRHESVDEWIDDISKINARYAESDVVRYIINAAEIDEQLPMIYILRKSEDYLRKHPQCPHSRSLTLYPNVKGHVLISLLSLFTSWHRNREKHQALFLPINRDSEGIEWLLGD